MLLTQEPTFVILIVVTQEPTIRKIVATHSFQNHGMISVTYHHHVKPNYKSRSFNDSGGSKHANFQNHHIATKIVPC